MALSAVRSGFQRLKAYTGLLKWLVALVLLAYLYDAHISQNWEDLERIANRGLQWGYVFVAFILCGSAVLLSFVRWYLLVWAQQFDFRLRDAMRLGFIGYLLNYVAPGQVGGDLFKAALIVREQKTRRMVAAATVFLDRVLGLLALVIVGALSSLFIPAVRQSRVLETVAAVLWAASAAGLIGLVVLLHPATPRSRWLNRLVHLRLAGRHIGEMINGIRLYQTKRVVLVVAVGMSLVGHVILISSFYFCSLALRLEAAAPNYQTHLFVIPAAEVGASFVPLPGGVGVLEGVISYFYGLTHSLPPADDLRKDLAEAGGLLVALMYRVITLLIAAIGFVYYIGARREIDAVVSGTGEASENLRAAGDGTGNEASNSDKTTDREPPSFVSR